ncbi:sensor histidine kinase [Bacillus luteolus]|uniref:histidine kinase n=1 Tax=Litchfieldia luteola TaxID=682179 RepID=A0ABR9QM20_9BACI|nr:sensor histidine kinase [Cytobacillus luteolus]MBE4909547.1 sensor histidine kinase [Cytobacillus luteolus]MBP1940948.1 signal transduction histidine kinase [Cytobacillus luteolus]
MNRERWMWIDWLIFSLRCGWYGTGLTYYYVYMERLGELSYLGFAGIVSIGFFIPLLFWRPGYRNPTFYAIAELLVSGGFSIYLNMYLGINLSSSIILMPILMVGYLMTKKTAPWVIPVFVILLPANRYWTIDNQFAFYLQYIDVLIFFVIALGFNLITKSQKRYKFLLEENVKQLELIEQQNRALEQYSAEIEKLALVEERNRMARDLHDSIGHHFTSVTVGLDAISYMIESQPKLAAEKVRGLAEVARTGLTEVRRTIHQIAPSEENELLTIQLEKLVSEFGEHTNTEVKFEVEGDEPDLAPHLKLLFVRCLQECMTNAKRHGEALFIKVNVHYLEYDIQLKVFNNGKGMDTENFGFGLKMMKNRLEEKNGLLTIESNGVEGVTVTCSLAVGGKR